jgi:hypothetical protein
MPADLIGQPDGITGRSRSLQRDGGGVSRAEGRHRCSNDGQCSGLSTDHVFQAAAFNANYAPGRQRWSGSGDLRHLQDAAALVSVQDKEAGASLIKTHVGSADPAP